MRWYAQYLTGTKPLLILSAEHRDSEEEDHTFHLCSGLIWSFTCGLRGKKQNRFYKDDHFYYSSGAALLCSVQLSALLQDILQRQHFNLDQHKVHKALCFTVRLSDGHCPESIPLLEAVKNKRHETKAKWFFFTFSTYTKDLVWWCCSHLQEWVKVMKQI